MLFVLIGQSQIVFGQLGAGTSYLTITRDTVVSKRRLLQGFELCALDSTLNILSFRFSFDCSKSDSVSIYFFFGKDGKISGDVESYRDRVSLISIGSYVFIDDIYAERNGVRKKLPSFYLIVTD